MRKPDDLVQLLQLLVPDDVPPDVLEAATRTYDEIEQETLRNFEEFLKTPRNTIN